MEFSDTLARRLTEAGHCVQAAFRARDIARDDPDVILAPWHQPFQANIYRRIFRELSVPLRKRWIFIVHDVLPHSRFPGDRWLARRGLELSERFLVLSRGQESALKNLLPHLRPEQVVFTPHPVYDGQRPFPGGREAARRELGITACRVLLFFGFVKRYKGLDVLLRAMPEILRDHSNTQLWVCGPFDGLGARYERLMKKLGIASAMVLYDRYFAGTDIDRVFAAADAVVLPYRKATQSGVIATAYALNTPVIASRVEGVEEYMRDGETGLLIPPRDPSALAAAVKRFFEAGGRSAFSPSVSREAARYSWKSFISCLEKLTFVL